MKYISLVLIFSCRFQIGLYVLRQTLASWSFSSTQQYPDVSFHRQRAYVDLDRPQVGYQQQAETLHVTSN